MNKSKMVLLATVTAAATAAIAMLASPAMAESVTADNGATFKMISAQKINNHWRGGDKPYVIATVADEDGQVLSFTFDCEGHYAFGSDWHSVPSRSVLARIGQIVCKAVGM